MHDSGRRRNRIVNLSGKGDCLSLMTMSVFARSFGARSFWQYRPLRSRVTVEGGREGGALFMGYGLLLSQPARYRDSGGHARIISNVQGDYGGLAVGLG